MRPEDIPVLEDYISFPEAALMLGMSNQGFHKLVFDSNAFDTVRAVGSKPLYLVPLVDVVRMATNRRARANVRLANQLAKDAVSGPIGF